MILILLLFLPTASSIAIDNGIIASPTITCTDDTISLNVRTERPFQGRVYVKGMSNVGQCVKDYSRNPPLQSFESNIDMIIPLGTCNMHRQRVLSPSGMRQSLTLVISFHPIFVTKVDRAFNIKCFYMMQTNDLTAALDVSMISTERIDVSRQVVPTCEYTVRKGSPDGPVVRFAVIGQKLYHVWQCESSDPLGILVRNCIIDGGSSNQFQALDANGCPTDRHVMPYLTYAPDLLSAYVETHAFKFADTPSLRFQCEISLCSTVPLPNRHNGETTCKGITPPACNGKAVIGGTSTTIIYPTNNPNARVRRQSFLSIFNTSRALPNQDSNVLDVVSQNDIMVMFDSDWEKLQQEQLQSSPTCEKSTKLNQLLALLSALLVMALCFCFSLSLIVWRRTKHTTKDPF